jgi:hypothetical protein
MDKYALIRPQLRDIDQRVIRGHCRERQRRCLSIAEAARAVRRGTCVDDHIGGERPGAGRYHSVPNGKSLYTGANRGDDAGAFTAERLAICPHGQRIHHIPEVESARGDTDFDFAGPGRATRRRSQPKPFKYASSAGFEANGFGRVLMQMSQPADEDAARPQSAFRFAATGQQLFDNGIRLRFDSCIRIDIDQCRLPIGMFERCSATNSKRCRLCRISHVGCNGGDGAARYDPETRLALSRTYMAYRGQKRLDGGTLVGERRLRRAHNVEEAEADDIVE